MSTHTAGQNDLMAGPETPPQRPQRRYRCRPILDGLPDYKGWSVEELRAFATQMQVPNAARKSRSELLGMFDVSTR